MHDVTPQASPRTTALGKKEVHIWQAMLDVGETAVQRLSAHLTPDEEDRASRFVFEGHRDRFKVARGILRELLSSYVGQSPASVQIETGRFGKPALSRESRVPDVRFNLTHSDGLALYAFSLEREVGIDVEKIRSGTAFAEIAERYFSAQEVQDLRALPCELRPEGFFLGWTRKEAYIKARGGGLNISLDSFDVSLTPGQPVVLNSTDRERWVMWPLNPCLGFAGALVVEGLVSEPRFLEWSDSAVQSPRHG
jgi:4'-phosphopantetheinyl transferase